MALRLIELNAIFDDHFRIAPPLDSKDIPVSGEVSEFGTGVSLGDGTSMEDVRGLENIQVVEKVGGFDKVREISMKDWLQNTIRENPNPVAVAASIENLLKNGQLSYFEQGREFATRLSMDPETKALSEKPVKREALPPVKPTLRFGQKFLRLFGAFKGEEADKYNRDLLSYELQKKALATTRVRTSSGISHGTIMTPTHDDSKGRILTGVNFNWEVATNVNNRIDRSMLSPEARSDIEYDILMGANPQEAIELRIGPKQNAEKILAEIYKNERPAGINNIQDHINARVAKQESFSDVRKMKDLQKVASVKLGSHVGDSIVSVMNGTDNNAKSPLFNMIVKSKAYKTLLQVKCGAHTLAENNQIFDQFARNLERYPIEGITPKQLKNLLDVCIEPHKRLRTTMESSKNGVALHVEDNKEQITKYIEKQVAKQESSQYFSILKGLLNTDPKAISSGTKFMFSQALFEIMNVNGKQAHPRESSLLTESDACKSMFEMKGGLYELVNNNRLFDQFAQNLEMNPIEGITPKQIENLLDVCIEQHKALRGALEASKNPEILKVANNKQNNQQNNKQNNKQPEKQIEKGASKKKPNGPNFG